MSTVKEWEEVAEDVVNEEEIVITEPTEFDEEDFAEVIELTNDDFSDFDFGLNTSIQLTAFKS